MNDIYITLTGNVAAEPRQHTFNDGSRVTSLRVASTNRYFDRKTKEWTDGDTVYFAVRCWRGLADNVVQSVQVGHPVVISGKLRIREFGPEGDRRFMPEVEAVSVGHDLRWGVGAFTKPQRSGGVATLSKETRESLDESTQDWAMGPSGAPAGIEAVAEPGSFGESGALARARALAAGTGLVEPDAFGPDGPSGSDLVRPGDPSAPAHVTEVRVLGRPERVEVPGHLVSDGRPEVVGDLESTSVEGDGAGADSGARVRAIGGTGRARRSKAGAVQVSAAGEGGGTVDEAPWPAGVKTAA